MIRDSAIVADVASLPTNPRRERLAMAKAAWVLLAALLVAVLLGRAIGAERAAILAPILAIAIVSASIVLLVKRVAGAATFLELGPLYLIIVTLYALFPLIGNVVSGGVYTELSDARMLAYGIPAASEIATIAWMYFVYISAFGVTYLLARGHNHLDARRIRSPGSTVLVAFLLFLIASELFGLYVRIAYRLNPTSYAETYLVIRQLPLAVRQMSAFAVGGAFVAKLGILLILFLNYRKNRLWIGLWLLFAIASAFLQPSAERGGLFLLLLSATMLYHYVVRPLRATTLMLLGLAGFTAYVTLGVLRSFGSGRIISPFGFTDFDGIFANAFDLFKRKQAGEIHLPLSRLYLGDLFVLVPQQLLPFEKFGAADWYMREFYPEAWAQGGGAAFGAIAEGIVGAGTMDLIWRGALLGLAFAGVQRFVARRTSFWVLLFYAWLVVYAYQSFRASTTTILNFAVYRFLPPVLMVRALAGLLQATAFTRRPLPA